MEDNEFEEVTIISHTDHGTSVLPQSTAERLMKSMRLEVTHKISATKLQAAKTSSAQLESFMQVLRRFVSVDSRVLSELKIALHNGYGKALPGLIIQDAQVFVLDGVKTPKLVPVARKGPIGNATWWQYGKYLVILSYFYQPVQVLDGKTFKSVHICNSKFATQQLWHVQMTAKGLYYLNKSNRITFLSCDLHESDLNAPSDRMIVDFLVDSDPDDVVLVLDDTGKLWRGKTILTQLPSDGYSERELVFLRRLRFGELLVVETIDDDYPAQFKVHLMNPEGTRVLDTSALSTPQNSLVKQVRLVNPRRSMQPIFLCKGLSIHLLVVFRKKIYPCAREVVDSTVCSLSFLEKGVWVFGGEFNTLGALSFSY